MQCITKDSLNDNVQEEEIPMQTEEEITTLDDDHIILQTQETLLTVKNLFWLLRTIMLI